MRVDRMTWVVALSVLLPACDPIYLIEPGDDEPATTHEGVITASETWRAGDNPHKVIGQLVVAGEGAPVLTIEPGVEVLFESRASLQIGTGDLPGSLLAVGTGSDRIRMRSQRRFTSRGYWGAVHVAPGAGEVRLEHVSIQDCGGTDDWPEACIRAFGSAAGRPRPVLRDVRIAFSSGYGVAVVAGTSFGDGSENVEFTSVSDYPIRVDAEGVHTLPSGLTFEAEGNRAIQVAGGTVAQNRSWPDPGVPYVVTGAIRVAGTGGPILTLPAGVELQFGREGEMLVGLTGPGGLVARGTEAAPILFTTPEKTPRGWRGLVFGSEALPDTDLSRVVVEYGGSPSGYNSVANATFMRDIGPVIRNSVIRHSSGCGVTRLSFDGVWATDFTDPALGNRFTGNEIRPQCTTQ